MASAIQPSSSNETISSIRNDTNYETYSLIWLDASINSEENLDAQEKLRSSINYLRTFDKLDECENYIQSVSSEDRIVLIVSGDFGQKLIPNILHFPQVSSIYIYCGNKEFHQQLSEQYSKVKGVFNQLNELINRIQSDQSGRRSHEADDPLSILTLGSKNNQEESTTGLDGRFLQSQLLLTCLLKMEPNATDRNEFISQCRQIYKNNSEQLQIVNEFEETYAPENSLSWYTKNAFVYRLLNKALRIQNIDLLFRFRFYIRDIEKQLSEYRCQSPIRVYRGQLMPKNELDVLINSVNKLISVNSFLSTSRKRDVAFLYSGSSATDNKLEKVLFVIDADPNQVGVKPFADISKMSYFRDEDEILMMVGSVFHLKRINPGDDKIWHIEMTLCSDNVLQTTFDYMKERYESRNNRLLLFANILIDLGNFDDAEKYLHRLLKELSSYSIDKSKCLHALGKVSCEKGNYDSSLVYLGEALEILREYQPNGRGIAYIHNSIGEVYQNKGDFEKAFESYQEALTIFQKNFPDDYKRHAYCYNNLGIIYEKQNKYPEARDALEKALRIKTEVLPAKHACLGNTYNNLGNVHYYLHEYDQALEKYQLSYQIFKNSITSRHPSMARILRNIGIIYEVKKDFIGAKKNYEEALNIRKKILYSTHPDVIEIKKDIERLTKYNSKLKHNYVSLKDHLKELTCIGLLRELKNGICSGKNHCTLYIKQLPESLSSENIEKFSLKYVNQIKISWPIYIESCQKLILPSKLAVLSSETLNILNNTVYNCIVQQHQITRTLTSTNKTKPINNCTKKSKNNHKIKKMPTIEKNQNSILKYFHPIISTTSDSSKKNQ